MNIPQEEIINLIQQLADHKKIRVCVKQSALIGAITGISALLGGILGGKNGALAGAAVGTVASEMLIDDYVSVADVIRNEMTYAQRRQLLQCVTNILMELPGPVTLFNILNNEFVVNSLTSVIKDSVTSLGYTI